MAVNEFDWSKPPTFCPFCGGAKLRSMGVTWTATSDADPSSEDYPDLLDEWQCQGECEGRSFFV